MKQLLLALLAALALPTTVNAFSFDKDLTIKNDIEENYLIKNSSI